MDRVFRGRFLFRGGGAACKSDGSALDMSLFTEEEDLKAVAAFAKESNVIVWMSATAEGDDLEDSAPKALLPYFAAVVHLASRNDGVNVQILSLRGDKNVNSTLKLDSKSLLITEK